MAKYIQVLLSDELSERLHADAKAEGRTNSNYASRIIEAHYKAPLTDKRRGNRKKELEFKEGDIVSIPKSSYEPSKPNMRVKVLAATKTWAMVRNAEYSGSMPFVASMRDLRHITTAPDNNDSHEVTA